MSEDQTPSTVTILNAIRATATSAYQETVPLATASNIQEVGESVLQNPGPILNEFLTALMNKVALQLFNDREFVNPLIDLRKGKLEFGQTIEDIFIEMAKAKEYLTGTRTGDESYPDPFEIHKPIAKTAYYSTLYAKQYPVTVHQNDLKRAFYNEDGVSRLIASIMTSLNNGQSFDDYRMTIALLARQIEQCKIDGEWAGDIHLLTDYYSVNNIAADDQFTTIDEALSSKDFLKFMANRIQKYARRLTKPRTDFNPAGVTTWNPKNEQRLLLLEDVQADLDTNLLAWAFNSDKLDIVGAVDLIDCWYSIGATATPELVTPEDISVKGELGDEAPCVALLYHPNMVKIYNKTLISTNSENARGLYYNIFVTCEDYYACSPFENFVAFFLD